MTTVSIQEAETLLLQLVTRVEVGEEIILTRGAEPVAKLIPIKLSVTKRQAGGLKGKISIGPDFFEPLPPEELDAWES